MNYTWVPISTCAQWGLTGSPQDKVAVGLRNTSSINEVYEYSSKR